MGDKVASSPVVMGPSGASTTVAPGTPKKAASAKSKNPSVKRTHPKTADMVTSAIIALKERGGSSVQAIKKYMVGRYNVDAEKQATFIKKYLKAAVASGVLIQTKGKGAAGSFKLASAKSETTKPKAKPAQKTAALNKKSTTAKKSVGAKKPAATTTKKVPAKKAAITAVSEKKNKVSKGPAAKPPKPKTTKTKPAAKSPAKAKPPATKKTKSAAAKPKKTAPKKTPVSKK